MVQPALGDQVARIIQRLHHYQTMSLRLTKEKWDIGIRRQMIVLPTGTGKTVVFSTLPLYFGFRKRILVLVHRDTLAEQAKRQIEFWNPEVGEVAIEMGNRRSNGSEQVIVASVQTIGRYRMEKQSGGRPTPKPNKRLLALDPDSFDAIIVDECHHSPSLSYRMIFRHFGFLDATFTKVPHPPRRLLFGVTATPKRLDGSLLNQVYDKKTYTYPIEDAIREGFLVNLRCYRVKTTSHLDGIAINGDDLDAAKLAKAVDTPARNRLVVDQWLALANNRKTICFAAGVKHAQALAAEFKSHGIDAEALWGNDPTKAEKLDRFKSGRLRIIVNCELLTEGFDDRSVDCIAMARPTASEALFRQCVGRGTRLQEGVTNLLQAGAEGISITKRDCLVLDFVDNTDEHRLALTFAEAFGLLGEMDLEGGSFLEAKDLLDRIATKIERSRRSGREVPEPPQDATLDELKRFEQEELTAEVEEVDLLKVKFDDLVLQNSDLQWHQLAPQDFILLLPHESDFLRLYRNQDNILVLDGSHISAGAEPFVDVGKVPDGRISDAFAYADHKVHSLFGAKVFSLCSRKSDGGEWKNKPASPAQIRRISGYFTERGRNVPKTITKGEASLLITMMNFNVIAANQLGLQVDQLVEQHS